MDWDRVRSPAFLDDGECPVRKVTGLYLQIQDVTFSQSCHCRNKHDWTGMRHQGIDQAKQLLCIIEGVAALGHGLVHTEGEYRIGIDGSVFRRPLFGQNIKVIIQGLKDTLN